MNFGLFVLWFVGFLTGLVIGFVASFILLSR